MQSTLQIMTSEGWQPVNAFAATNADRQKSEAMEAAAKGNLAAAFSMPSDSDDNRRNRHLALSAAYRDVFKADDFRKGARSYARL